MKKLRLTRLLAVILALIMVLPLFAACKKKTYDNEKDQLVVGLEEPDGVFNSFFATSGNDTTVAGTVAASMISMDKNAKIVCGPRISQRGVGLHVESYLRPQQSQFDYCSGLA